MITSINLGGKVALVTGAARGIGAAVAKTLAAAGASVVVSDLESCAKLGQRVVDEIAESGGQAVFIGLDVSNEDNWQSVIQVVKESYGGLDILVNNAGVVLVKPVEETGLEELHRITRVNIDGVFLGIKYALPLLKECSVRHKSGGSVINFSSAMGIKGYPFGSLYSMSKGAIRLFSKSVALEFAQLGYNVRVNSIHPGLVDTAMVDEESQKLAALGAMGTSTKEEMRQAFRNLNPLGRFGLPDEIANTVLFLASDLSSFVNGSELVVDGGETAQ